MISKPCALVALTTALAVLPLRKAHALYVEEQLTPGNLTTTNRTFTITSKDVGAEKEFDVTVESTAKTGFWKILSLSRLGRLTLSDGHNEIANVLVQEDRVSDTKVTYWFRVSPRLLVDSRFDFSENGYKVEKLGHGQTRVIGIPGGVGYWFFLKDFAEPKQTKNVPRTHLPIYVNAEPPMPISPASAR